MCDQVNAAPAAMQAAHAINGTINIVLFRVEPGPSDRWLVQVRALIEPAAQVQPVPSLKLYSAIDCPDDQLVYQNGMTSVANVPAYNWEFYEIVQCAQPRSGKVTAKFLVITQNEKRAHPPVP